MYSFSRSAQVGKEDGAVLLEKVANGGAGERCGATAGGAARHEVCGYVAAVLPGFKMQVRAGRAAGRTGQGNDRVHVDRSPFVDVINGMVRIDSNHAVVVIQNDSVAVAAFPAAEDDRSGRHRLDRRTARGGDVETVMMLESAVERIASEPGR